MKKISLLFCLLPALFSCNGGESSADAYGHFETTETRVAAMASGQLLRLKLTEGQQLHKGDTIGYIDTQALFLQKKQLQAQCKALRGSLPARGIQLQVIEQQLQHALKEQQRMGLLLAGQAATPQQKDDRDAQVNLLQKKYTALKASLSRKTQSILAQIEPLRWQIKQLNLKIHQSILINPVAGTVLTQFAEPKEVVTYGQPLYTIGNLEQLTLRAYATATQLPQLHIGDTVTVRTDAADGGYYHWPGVVSWIAAQSEFTPKQIETKEERANRVYAIKIRVNNDGRIHIGTPGEVLFNASTTHHDSH